MIPGEQSELFRINAMMDAGVRLAAINLSRGYVAFDNGLTLPIIRMRDRDGQTTQDAEECFVLDFGDTEIGFGTVRVVTQVEYHEVAN